MNEPLFLEGSMHDKIWGGTDLRDEFGYDIPTETTGELWAISAHENGPSTVKAGPYAGKTLADLWKEERELFGPTDEEEFPLLVKIIDAQKDLSVQVHPDDEYAAEHAGESGKTECWFVLKASPGAQIVYGHNAQTEEELKEMIDSGDFEHLLRRHDVKAGDFLFVPSGTVHAIGAGVMLLEVQQSSDTTYRIYDYDRLDENGSPRDLHLKEALDVIEVPHVDQTPPPFGIGAQGGMITLLIATPFFSVEKWDVDGKMYLEKPDQYSLLSIVAGDGELIVDEKNYPVKKGDHLLLPYDIPNFELDGELTVIAAHPGE